MDNQKFIETCKRIVRDETNVMLRPLMPEIELSSVFVVWSCKTLKNNKALLSTNVPDDMYFEITFDGAAEKMYVDAYHKRFKRELSFDDIKAVQ
jgi:hypothetical protein